MPGGGKGGGGSVSAPKIDLNPPPTGEMMSLYNMADYAGEQLAVPESMGNWASAIATGGNALPVIAPNWSMEPYGAGKSGDMWSYGGVPGPTFTPGVSASTGTMGVVGGPEASGVPGAGGVAGSQGAGASPGAGGGTSVITFDGESNPTGVLVGAPVNSGGQMVTPLYNMNTGGFEGWQTASGQNVRAATTQGLAPMSYIPGGTGGASGGYQGSPARGSNVPSGGLMGQQNLGPLLSTEWQNILGEENVAGQIPGIQAQTAAINADIKQGENMLSQAVNSPTGLTPQQQAYVDQATKSGQAQIAQQLGSEGLTSSTQNALLQEEVAQSGAATAGQLQQGNIQLLQAAQKLALGGQELSLGEQDMLFNQLGQIAQQAGGFQSMMYQEALQGYGLLGQFFNMMLAPMGMNMQGYGDMLNAESAVASDQTQLEAAQLQAQQSQAGMMGGLFQGLGSLLGGGGGGGGGGGLLGGLGGLFGAGAGAAGGLAAAGGAGATAAGIGAVGAGAGEAIAAVGVAAI
jgi:hypothetical protein